MSAHPYRLRHPSKRMAWLGAVVLLLAGAPASGRVDPLLDDNAGYHAPVPLGLPKPHQPLDPAAVRLGKRLFFDPRLSADASVSCATCHAPRATRGIYPERCGKASGDWWSSAAPQRPQPV
ncbi:MAG: hypothetical protein CMQ49_03315 [Gammaproteobacteria bacterium]|nr:hypothetical protein [Gammaproteobacteria bacterium]